MAVTKNGVADFGSPPATVAGGADIVIDFLHDEAIQTACECVCIVMLQFNIILFCLYILCCSIIVPKLSCLNIKTN